MGTQCCTNNGTAKKETEECVDVAGSLVTPQKKHSHREERARSSSKFAPGDGSTSLAPDESPRKLRAGLSHTLTPADTGSIGTKGMGSSGSSTLKSGSTGHVHVVLEFKPHESKMRGRTINPAGEMLRRPQGYIRSMSHCLQAPGEYAKVLTLRKDTGRGELLDRSMAMPTVQFSTMSFRVEPQAFRRENNDFLEEKYLVMEFIGCGAFGEVRKIREFSTGTIRALKIINKDSCQMTDNFADEIQILKRLVLSQNSWQDHPNLVKFYEFFQDENSYYLITEYNFSEYRRFCEGGNLFDRLDSLCTLVEPQVAMIMRQILSAVEYCHSQGIVQRDMKLENVLFSKEDISSSVKVIDFGRSKILRANEKLMDLAGSLYYMAPEVVSGLKYNEKCDIWSCGVICYALLVGELPFNGGNRRDTLARIKKGFVDFDNELWENISSDAVDLVRKMLTYDPERRISAKEALASRWLASEPGERVLSSECKVSLRALKKFNTQSHFQQAVLGYIATQQLHPKEEAKLREMFSMFDINRDGKISIEELTKGYAQLCGNVVKARAEAKTVMQRIDANRSGYIEYTEFLMANLKINEYMEKQALKEAFAFYDTNGDGQISLAELRSVFGAMHKDETLRKVIREADLNHDRGNGFMTDRYLTRSL